MVDPQGRVIVVTTSYDKALAFQGQIHSYGADPQLSISKGSMSAVLERAE